MSRTTTKIGDVFEVELEGRGVKYFQYIVSDLTQLNSDVIRGFKDVYSLDESPDLVKIAQGEVEFYAHCATKLGIKGDFWKRVGNVPDVGKIEHIVFRLSGDYGNPKIEISNNWWIWKINEQMVCVGKLEGDDKKAEIGVIFNSESIANRIKTGQVGFHPRYE